MAESPVEPRVTQAGSIEAVATAVVGAVAPFVTALPKESLRATFGAHKYNRASALQH